MGDLHGRSSKLALLRRLHAHFLHTPASVTRYAALLKGGAWTGSARGTRGVRWGPRTIDLDILLYGSWIIHLPGLQVPHPRMSQRRFVMTPMAEIAPQLKHPVLQRSMESLLGDCPDPLPVHKLNPPVHNNA